MGWSQIKLNVREKVKKKRKIRTEFENICKGGSQVVSAVTASILMDPSFRIIDCEAFDDNVIGTVPYSVPKRVTI